MLEQHASGAMEYSFVITWDGGRVFGDVFPDMDVAEAAALAAAKSFVAGGAKGAQVIVGAKDGKEGVIRALIHHVFDLSVPVKFMAAADAPSMLKERVDGFTTEGGVKAEVCRDAVAGTRWEISGPDRVATFDIGPFIHDLAAEVLGDA